MSDRERQRLDFLKTAGLADAVRTPLAGDASTRRYERLTTPSGRSLMLMDQVAAAESPPADPAWSPERRRAEGWNATARLSAGRIEAFAAVAGHMRDVGLSAPMIPALDAAAGLAVLEDFGVFCNAPVRQHQCDWPRLVLRLISYLIMCNVSVTL